MTTTVEGSSEIGMVDPTAVMSRGSVAGSSAPMLARPSLSTVFAGTPAADAATGG